MCVCASLYVCASISDVTRAALGRLEEYTWAALGRLHIAVARPRCILPYSFRKMLELLAELTMLCPPPPFVFCIPWSRRRTRVDSHEPSKPDDDSTTIIVIVVVVVLITIIGSMVQALFGGKRYVSISRVRVSFHIRESFLTGVLLAIAGLLREVYWLMVCL